MTFKKETMPPHKVMLKYLVYGATRLAWMLAPVTTVNLIVKTFFSPPKYNVSEHEKAALAAAKPFHLTVNRKKVVGWVWGEGPAVIMVHGWGGSGLQFSSFIEPLVSAGYSVVAYDNPAHGQSEGGSTNYFEFVETIGKVYEQIGTVVGVVSHSMGSGAAMNLQHKIDKELKLVFVAPLFNLMDVLMEFVDKSGLYKVIFITIIEKLEAQYNRRLTEMAPSSLVGLMRSEALIFHDRDDRVTPMREAELLERNWERARLVKTSRLGHNRILKSKEVIEQTISFMRSAVPTDDMRQNRQSKDGS